MLVIMGAIVLAQVDELEQLDGLFAPEQLTAADGVAARRRLRGCWADHGRNHDLQPDFSSRHNLRGVFDGRYKLVRYFALDGYNTPQDVEELREKNNLALYDLQTDPQERDNLANRRRPRYDENLLASLNVKLNALIRTEIGTDKALVKRPLLKIIGSTISEKLRSRF